MSKLKKCLYLINLLERKGALTLKEINDYYQYSSLYEGEEILPRTFLRYKDYIDETFPCLLSIIRGRVSTNCIDTKRYMERMTRCTTTCCQPTILKV